MEVKLAAIWREPPLFTKIPNVPSVRLGVELPANVMLPWFTANPPANTPPDNVTVEFPVASVPAENYNLSFNVVAKLIAFEEPLASLLQ
jgi:hypothetical protein